jgi:flagellar hook-associated protein 2
VGSPISFSGFNQIDFGAILNAVMGQERVPLDTLNTQKKSLESQNTLFGTLATKLANLKTATGKLQDVDSLAALDATSSDTGVGVSATGGNVAGTYDVVVSELARAQVNSSTSTYAALTSVVATAGTLTITPATGAPVPIALTGSTTLEGLASAINAEADSPVAASVVQTAPGIYKLVLTGKETGTSNAFTLSHTFTGGLGLTFTDTDNDGTYGDDPLTDNTQSALNASFTVNNLAISSASNVVTDAVPGVTLTLRKKDPATTVTIDVSRDVSAAKAVVQKFISAYNDVLAFQKDQETAANADKPNISRDPLLRGFRNSIRFALSDDYNAGGTYTKLAGVGVGFDSTGKLALDEAVFEDALASSPTDVQHLFSGAAGGGGAFGALDDLVTDYTQSGGLVASARTRITDQVSALNKRLDRMEEKLALRRDSLQKEYIAADMAMTKMKAQSSSLETLGGQYRLF